MSKNDQNDADQWDWLNGHLSEDEKLALEQDPLTRRELESMEHELAQLLLMAPPASPPSTKTRRALLEALEQTCRFEEFIPEIAQHLDISHDQARDYLLRIDRPESWEFIPIPGVSLFHVEGGPSVAQAITGFVRIKRGAVFPPHRHIGQETAVILQGTLIDSHSGRHKRGDTVIMDADSEHLIEADAKMDLIYLTVIQTGIKVLGLFIDHDSPLM